MTLQLKSNQPSIMNFRMLLGRYCLNTLRPSQLYVGSNKSFQHNIFGMATSTHLTIQYILLNKGFVSSEIREI